MALELVLKLKIASSLKIFYFGCYLNKDVPNHYPQLFFVCKVEVSDLAYFLEETTHVLSKNLSHHPYSN